MQLGKESVKSSHWYQKSCQNGDVSVLMAAQVSEFADFSGEGILVLWKTLAVLGLPIS